MSINGRSQYINKFTILKGSEWYVSQFVVEKNTTYDRTNTQPGETASNFIIYLSIGNRTDWEQYTKTNGPILRS